jgi:hypothetical protein
MIKQIIIALIGIIIYFLPGILMYQITQFQQQTKQTPLLQAGLIIGYSMLISISVGLILGFLGLFHRLGFLLSLTIISLVLFIIVEAKRYKHRNKPKKHT